MEILPYTDEHRRFRKQLSGFCRTQITPFADQWEKDRLVPRKVWQKMGRQGFLCTAVSSEFDGAGGDFLYSVVALEEVSKTNQFGLIAFLHSDIVVPYIEAYGSEEQKRRYLPGCVSGDILTAVAMTEPGAGSDLAGMQTTAEEDGAGVLINGSKTFISNGVSCDLVVLAARDPAIEDPHKAISLYLVEDGTEGFKKGRQLDKLGVHSQDTNELFFSNCRVPAKNRLGWKGDGFIMLMEKLQQERLLVALLALSKAEFIVEWMSANGREVLSRGQANQFAFVEMVTEVKMARTFTDKLIVDHMEGTDIVSETSMAKYWNTDLGNRVANRCLDMLEESGALESCPIVRTFRDLKVAPIFAGTNEIMKTIIAKRMGL